MLPYSLRKKSYIEKVMLSKYNKKGGGEKKKTKLFCEKKCNLEKFVKKKNRKTGNRLYLTFFCGYFKFPEFLINFLKHFIYFVNLSQFQQPNHFFVYYNT